jgi:hypothetical protein
MNNGISKLFSLDKLAENPARVEEYAGLICNNSQAKEYILNGLLNNPDINVYFNCHLIVVRATEVNPALFYDRFGDFRKLLSHKNSYHRNYGLLILANLTKADNADFFEEIFNEYYSLLKDPKFMTRRYCLQCSAVIIQNKPGLAEEILKTLVSFLINYRETLKQRNLLIKDFIAIIGGIKGVINIPAEIGTEIKKLAETVKMKNPL